MTAPVPATPAGRQNADSYYIGLVKEHMTAPVPATPAGTQNADSYHSGLVKKNMTVRVLTSVVGKSMRAHLCQKGEH